MEEERRRELEEEKPDQVGLYFMRKYGFNDNKDPRKRTEDYLNGLISLPPVLFSDQFDLELLKKSRIDPCLDDDDDDDDDNSDDDNRDYYLEDPEGREEISNLAKFAIDEHNKSIQQSGIKYVFEDILSVTWRLAAGYQHYMTFSAMEIDNKGGEPKLRTIKAGVFDKERVDYTLKYFHVISDSDPEEVRRIKSPFCHE